MIFLGTGPTPGITEAQYKRRKQIIDLLYANAADETSRKMTERLARSWDLLSVEQKEDKNQTETRRK